MLAELHASHRAKEPELTSLTDGSGRVHPALPEPSVLADSAAPLNPARGANLTVSRRETFGLMV